MSCLSMEVSKYEALNMIISLLIPKLVYKSVFAFFLSLLVKKIEMFENGPKYNFELFSNISIFLTKRDRKKAKTLLYTNLVMSNEINMFRATYLGTSILKQDIEIFGVFQ